MELESFTVWLGQPNYTDTSNSDYAWYLKMVRGNQFTLNVSHLRFRSFVRLYTEEFTAFLASGLDRKPSSDADNSLSATNLISFQQKEIDELKFNMSYSPSEPLPRIFNVTFEFEQSQVLALNVTEPEAQCMLDFLQSGGNYNELKLPDNLFTSISIENPFGADLWTFYYDKTVVNGAIGISLFKDEGTFNNYSFTASNIATLRNFLENPIAPGIDCIFLFGDINWIWSYHPDEETRFSFKVEINNGTTFKRNIVDLDIQALFSWLNSIPQ